MIGTVEAVIRQDGSIELLEPTRVAEHRRALVTILDDPPRGAFSETVLLSEASLAVDWNRPEEDESWSHLQSEP